MANHVIDKPEGSPELVPLFVGHEDCKPRHKFGPYIRDSYLIHYCLSGCGTLHDRHGEHKISHGEMFIIRPGEVTTYEADANNPWSYVWIGFSGKRADSLLALPSVVAAPKDAFVKILSADKNGESAADIYISALYEIFYNLFSEKKSSDVISVIKRFIDYNYMNEISVSKIASRFGLERSYLFRIFKRKLGIGVKEYITEVKMIRAEQLLAQGYSVSECAAMVGYSDPFNFSRAYKKRHSTPPKNARNKT